MRRHFLVALAVGIGTAITATYARAQEGIGEKLGEKFNRGVSRVGEELRAGWAEIRATVDKLGVQGRVYGRLHWDKDLADATLDIEVREDHVVVLKGSVPSHSAKTKAVQLTQDTIGVREVVDKLAVPES